MYRKLPCVTIIYIRLLSRRQQFTRKYISGKIYDHLRHKMVVKNVSQESPNMEEKFNDGMINIEYLSILILIDDLMVRSVVVIILTSRSLRYRQSRLTVSLFLYF